MIILSAISEACVDLLQVVNDTRSKDKVLEDCVRKKLFKIYKDGDDEYDRLLDKLEVNANAYAFTQVNSCIIKIHSLLNKNRKTLFKTMERLC